jgi:2-amino-4-hydroxy-6-hydroxymethyldihydropteridine diphosphokinase
VKGMQISPDFKILKASSIYETKPFGVKNQDNFINAVIKVETNLDLHSLLKLAKNIEVETGRKETFKWGPREIDIDILFFNDLIYSDEEITVPHKGIPERDFVLTPLCEIEPGLIHPVLKQKISDICISGSERSIIRILHKKILK